MVNIDRSLYHGSAPDIGAFEYGFVVGIRDDGETPEEFALLQNYPNPFNNTTTIPVMLKSSSQVELCIFNPLGQKVKSLFNGYKPADTYYFSWDGSNDFNESLPLSVYVCELLAGDFVDFKKMMTVR